MRDALQLRLILFGVLACLLVVGWTFWELLRPYKAYPGEVVVEIRPRTGVKLMASQLQNRGVLAHRRPFLVLYALMRPWHGIQAGEYLFGEPMRPWDVYWKLVAGEVRYYPVTIPEGMDIFDVAKAVAHELPIPEPEFLEVARDVSLIRDLDPEADSLEGYLFPDTYHFARHSQAQAVARTMVSRFRAVLADFRPLPGKTGMGLRETIILASLVEKETGREGERPLISGVFRNRLRRRVLLQCDPTVIYAARLNDRYVGVIRQSDLDYDSAYNTYRYAGLPPGPICNPGLRSIRAALEPADTDYMYFVSDGRGGHVFSSTGSQHVRAVARYRRAMRLQAAARATRKKEVSQPGATEKK